MKKIILFVLILQLSSAISNAQWVQLPNAPYGATIQCFTNSGTNLFAGTYLSGIFLSTNYGENWSARGITGQTVYSIVSSGVYLFAGTLSSVYRSSNNGSNWADIYNAAGTLFLCLASNGSNVFAGTNGSGILRSTNNGDNWTTVNNGLTNTYIHSLLTSGTNIFAATNGGVFLSTDNGFNWSAINTGLTNLFVNVLASSGINLYAGTWGGGVFVSSINGGTWTASNNGLANHNIRTLTVSEPYVLISNSNGVFLSAGPGSIWRNRNQGFITIPVVNSLLVLNNYIYAGTANQSVWRRNLSEIITSTELISQSNTDSYSLKQNYPNPFNPATNIRYEIPKTGFVKLVVFDALGCERRTLVNEVKQAGNYSVDFIASELSSGIYFYKLESNGFSDIKKMMLIK
ncbi:MAG: T9SS type A sorting domain-containing protein [Ignavibacteria bacterium]